MSEEEVENTPQNIPQTPVQVNAELPIELIIPAARMREQIKGNQIGVENVKASQQTGKEEGQ